MAAKSTLINMALCLSAVCLVCSAILGGTYALTKASIENAQQQKTNASIAKVLPEFAGNPEQGSISVDGVNYDYYCAEGAGVAVVSNVTGFGGTLSVMVGVTEEGKVHNTAVLSHSETPGLGAKCQSDEKFLSQFRGLDPAQKTLAVVKDGGSIDAITASTITSRAYTLAVRNAVAVAAAINNGGQDNE